MKFNEVAKSWLDSKRGFVKESTISVYDGRLRYHVYPYFEGVDIDTFKKSDAQRFIGHLFEKGLSKRSVKDIEIILKQILSYAADTYDFAVSYQFKLKYPTGNMAPASERELPVYSADDLGEIMRYYRDNPSCRMLGIIITICSGLRIGELCGLRWSDVNFDEGTISVKRTVERIYDYNDQKTKVIIQSPKTVNSCRTIPLPLWLCDIMRSAQGISPDDYYVLTSDRDPIEPRTYRNYYVRVIKEGVGLSRCIKFHGLRHTYATQLITNGADAKSVSAMLGHSTVATTLDIYTHTPMEKRREIANTITL